MAVVTRTAGYPKALRTAAARNALAGRSRWSCEGDRCCIIYFSEESTKENEKMRIAFLKTDERIQNLDVTEFTITVVRKTRNRNQR